MEKRALDFLSEAISDVGEWQWWFTAKDMFQLEFCGVMMYDETKAEKEPHSSVIALRFYGDSFAVFLDDLEEDGEKPWFDRLHDDEVPPFPVDAYELAFDDVEYARIGGVPLHLQIFVPACRNSGFVPFAKEQSFRLPCFVFVQGSAW